MIAVKLKDPHRIYDSSGSLVRVIGTDIRFSIEQTCENPPGCVFHCEHLVVSGDDGTRLTLPTDHFRPVFRIVVGRPS